MAKKYSIKDVVEEESSIPKKRYSTADVIEEIPEVSSSAEPALKSFTQGALQGVTSGFADEGAGALTAFDKAARDIFKGRVSPADVQGFYENVKGNYKSARDKYREGFDKSKTDNPKTYVTGQFGGAIAQSAIPGMQISPANGLLKVIGQSAAQGALQGIGENENEENLGSDITKSALIGGASGAIGKRLSKLTDAKGLAESAGENAAKALGYTKRFISKGGKDRAIEVGKTMLDEGVVKPFSNPDTMSEGVSDLISKTGNDIGQFLKKKGSGYDTKSAIVALDNLRPRASDGDVLIGGAYDEINKLIDNAVNTARAHKKGVIPFEEANGFKNLLQDIVNWKSTDLESNVGKQIAGAVRGSIDDSLENLGKGIPDTVSKEEMAQFLKNKKVYGAAQEAQDAINDRLASGFNKGVGLTDTILLSGGMGGGALTNPVGTAAVYGAKKGLEKFGRSTVGSLEYKLSKLIEKAPPSAQKYMPALLEAARRGTASLINTATNIADNDSEFAAILQEVQ